MQITIDQVQEALNNGERVYGLVGECCYKGQRVAIKSMAALDHVHNITGACQKPLRETLAEIWISTTTIKDMIQDARR